MAKEIKGIVRPPLEMPAELQGQRSRLAVRKSAKVEVPLLITLFAWYCFLRAALFAMFGLIVGIAPESVLAVFAAKRLDPVPPPISPEPAFYALAILHAILGWRWLTRDWRARWGAMFLSGATAAQLIVDLIGSRLAGTAAPAQDQATMVAIGWNGLVCCYLAFYPGMKEAFKETPWE